MVQSPYARLIVGVPYLAISSSNSVVRLAVVLSESIRTASRMASASVTSASSRKPAGRLEAGAAGTVCWVS